MCALRMCAHADDRALRFASVCQQRSQCTRVVRMYMSERTCAYTHVRTHAHTRARDCLSQFERAATVGVVVVVALMALVVGKAVATGA